MGIIGLLLLYGTALLQGLAITLAMCAIIWVLGLSLGSLFGVAAASWPTTMGSTVELFAYAVRAIPVLVILFWVHYPFQYLVGVTIDPFVTAVATLSVVNIILVSDIVRGVLRQFPHSYVEAGRVSGMSEQLILTRIKGPIVLRQVSSSLLSQQIQMLQVTIFASLIGVEELFRVAQRINSLEYRPIEVYTGMALFFLVICLPLYVLSARLEIKFSRLFGSH